jgi:hypothetical protein
MPTLDYPLPQVPYQTDICNDILGYSIREATGCESYAAFLMVLSIHEKLKFKNSLCLIRFNPVSIVKIHGFYASTLYTGA